MGLRERKKRFTREMILSNSMNLFAQKGVREVGMRELAKVCGLGIGTYYNYFRSKDEVVLSLFFKLLSSSLESAMSFHVEGSPEEKMAKLYEHMFEALEDKNSICEEFFRAIYYPEIVAEKEEEIAEVAKIFTESIFRKLELRSTSQYDRNDLQNLIWNNFLQQLNYLIIHREKGSRYCKLLTESLFKVL